MIPVWLKKLLTLITSSLAGLLVSGAGATVVISVVYYLAEDGPIFPPPLVAFFAVAPVLALLAALQVGALAYEWRTGTRLGLVLLGPALLGGSGGAGLLHRLLDGPYADGLDLLALVIFLGLGLAAGLAVFGTHWLAGWAWELLDSPRSRAKKELGE